MRQTLKKTNLSPERVLVHPSARQRRVCCAMEDVLEVYQRRMRTTRSWSALRPASSRCGNGGDDQAPEPDLDATTGGRGLAVSAVMDNLNKTILDSRATTEAEQPPTATPVATPEPSPTPTAVPMVAPTQASTQQAGGTGTDGGDPQSAERLAPLAPEDADAFLADVSDSERMCLSDNIPSDRMVTLATTPELASEADREAFIECLEHETLLRLLLTPVLNATGPLSVESSACMHSSYADMDLAALMSGVTAEPAGPEAEAAMAQGMVMFFVSLSCLNEAEFQTASVAMGLAPGERENFLCVLDEVGGQAALAALLVPSDEFPAELFEAAFSCQFQMGGPPPS